MTIDDATTIDPGPFGIDTPDFSDRDREMFVLGYEYAEVSRDLREIGRRIAGKSTLREVLFTIHEANAGRLVALAESLGLCTETLRIVGGWCRFQATVTI